MTMTANETQCRAWVGSLAAYNAGRLVGAWIDLDGKDAADVAEEAREAMRPEIAGWMSEAEAFDELWVFDYEGLKPFVTGECNIAEAVRACELLAEVDEDKQDAFRAYAENIGAQYADADGFEEAYQGEYATELDFAYALIDDLEGIGAEKDSLAARYFDYEAFARDLFLSDYWYDASTHTVFRNL